MRKLLALALLSLAASSAEAAVTIGASAHNTSTSTTLSVSITCPAGTTMLMGIVSWDQTGITISSVTFNGVSMGSPSGSSLNSSSQIYQAAYVAYSPPTGSAYAFLVTFSASTYDEVGHVFCFSGTPTSAGLGTWATNQGTGSATATSVTPTGGATGDLYIGSTMLSATTVTSTGTNQTNLLSDANVGGYSSISTDDIPGQYTGAFTWTGGGTVNAGWTALGVQVIHSTAATCTHSGWSAAGSGTKVVPTAGSTSVWLSTRVFGTVDCSTTNYWQIPGGVFGVN